MKNKKINKIPILAFVFGNKEKGKRKKQSKRKTDRLAVSQQAATPSRIRNRAYLIWWVLFTVEIENTRGVDKCHVWEERSFKRLGKLLFIRRKMTNGDHRSGCAGPFEDDLSTRTHSGHLSALLKFTFGHRSNPPNAVSGRALLSYSWGHSRFLTFEAVRQMILETIARRREKTFRDEKTWCVAVTPVLINYNELSIQKHGQHRISRSFRSVWSAGDVEMLPELLEPESEPKPKPSALVGFIFNILTCLFNQCC